MKTITRPRPAERRWLDCKLIERSNVWKESSSHDLAKKVHQAHKGRAKEICVGPLDRQSLRTAGYQHLGIPLTTIAAGCPAGLMARRLCGPGRAKVRRSHLRCLTCTIPAAYEDPLQTCEKLLTNSAGRDNNKNYSDA